MGIIQPGDDANFDLTLKTSRSAPIWGLQRRNEVGERVFPTAFTKEKSYISLTSQCVFVQMLNCSRPLRKVNMGDPIRLANDSDGSRYRTRPT